MTFLRYSKDVAREARPVFECPPALGLYVVSGSSKSQFRHCFAVFWSSINFLKSRQFVVTLSTQRVQKIKKCNGKYEKSYC